MFCIDVLLEFVLLPCANDDDDDDDDGDDTSHVLYLSNIR